MIEQSQPGQSSLIFGLEPKAPLPDGWTPLEAVAVVKCLDEGGDVALVLSGTEALPAWESLGMLAAALSVTTNGLREAFIVDDDEDDD